MTTLALRSSSFKLVPAALPRFACAGTRPIHERPLRNNTDNINALSRPDTMQSSAGLLLSGQLLSRVHKHPTTSHEAD